jgi:(1->4)-alpha-D-glucan 1-alpha-D-glucosylmutase
MPKTSFRATYRLQLRKEFTFQDAAGVVGYLDELGISHVYLSPILESREGSNHGYDGIDPTRISEERGGEEGFEKLVARIEQSRQIEGLILDIVPNHLSSSWKNPAWWDLLKHGRASKHWKTFDVKPRPGNDARVILPVLGRSRQSALASREISIGLHEGQLAVKYFDHRYPLDPRTYAEVKSAVKKVGGDYAKLPLKVIEEILAKQNYVLRDWRSGSQEINYRRFFDINDLAGIRIEEPEVFKWAHAKIVKLMKAHKIIQGLRIDHVDGLTFPSDYLEDLAKISKNVWVEKILGDGEKLPASWPVLGSTGYEFSNISSRLFVDLKGLSYLHSHYLQNVDDRWERFHDCVYESKREMLESQFVSELNYLTNQLYAIAGKQKKNRPGFLREDLAEALTELTSSLRVYRTYARRGKPLASRFLDEALAETEGRGRVKNKHALNWLRTTLLDPKGRWSEELYLNIKRWEQLTGPVMAKGLEDTALYRYCPLLSLNGVGGEPDWRGDGSVEYHAFYQEQLREHPQSMNTSSTHDTKRSEDVRSRIHVLSELSEEWTKLFESYPQSDARHAPSTRAAYLIFETMIGAWPFDGKITESFVERMQSYMIKAAREAKTETSWNDVNGPYEEALKKFVKDVLKPKDPEGRAFLQSLRIFAEKCTYYGVFNSLASVVLKVASPGVPDFYQGCDLWDLSLVDPDNRRPVDYQLRQNLLRELKKATKESPQATMKDLITNWKSGKIKLWLTWKLLQLKQQNPALFDEGEYIALEPKGKFKQHFVALLRKHEGVWLLVVVPRFLANKQDPAKRLQVVAPELLATEFALPHDAPATWRSLFSGRELAGQSLAAKGLFADFPVAVFTGV